MATSFSSLATPLAAASLTSPPNATAVSTPSFPLLGSLLLKMVTTFGIMGGGGVTTEFTLGAGDAEYFSPTAEESAMPETSGGAHGDAVRSFSFRRDSKGIHGPVGNIFGYMTSSWAMLCIFMAILLNRTLIYASLRRPIRPSLKLRCLRILPIILFLIHIRSIAYSMRCQSSSFLPVQAYPQAINIPYSEDDKGGFLYYFSRLLSFWYPTSASDVYVCRLASMLPNDVPEQVVPTTLANEQNGIRGSLSILWPLYKTICLSLFISTFSHALTGRSSAGLPSSSSETGLSLFEASFAFAEAEALADPRTGNISLEVLYIAAISSLAHLTSQIIGLLSGNGGGTSTGYRYRLISTGIWGIAFLGGFAWGILRGKSKVLNFPTVCIVGFIPHLLVFFGILLCGAIYILAAIFSTLVGLPAYHDSQTPTLPFLSFQNLQANITLSTLSISLSEDFYTALLKVGFMCLTAASTATYLNEGDPITLPGLTWLERERVRVLERERQWKLLKAAKGGLIEGQSIAADGKGPYSNEQKEIRSHMVGLEDRLGGDEKMGKRKRKMRSIRGRQWAHAVDFLRGVVGVSARWIIHLLTKLLRRLRLVGRLRNVASSQEENVRLNYVADKEIPSDDSSPPLTPCRARHSLQPSSRSLDTQLSGDDISSGYRQFLTGPLDDDEDNSSDYTPTDLEDWSTRDGSQCNSDEDEVGSQLLSEQSEWSSVSDSEYSDPDENDGNRTPRAQSPRQRESSSSGGRTPKRKRRGRENPLHLLEMLDRGVGDASLSLAALLDPQTPEQRHWAKILARHLSSSRIITRRQNAEMEDSVLATTQGRNGGKLRGGGLVGVPGYGYLGNDQDAEGDALEAVILERRSTLLPRAEMSGGSNLENDDLSAPLCVVCQSAPRTIIVWPCSCFSLCEECRVSLAMRNFGTCVCCRRDVGGFSRIWVP